VGRASCSGVYAFMACGAPRGEKNQCAGDEILNVLSYSKTQGNILKIILELSAQQVGGRT
jgi:hypothetical protein